MQYTVICVFNFRFQTSRVEFDEALYVVRRRYNDFLWLRQKLVEAFPTHLIPVRSLVSIFISTAVVALFWEIL